MKTPYCCWKSGLCLVSSLVILTCATKVFAQTTYTNPIPVVTIQATQPIASGPGNPGVFTVFRHGNTNETLNVFYDIGGTASNSVDYKTISQWVAIPAGVTSNTVTITPTGNMPSNPVKTVVLQLGSSPAVPPVNYEIGVPSNAVVYITSPTITNFPPVVRMVSPANGSVFRAPVNIPLFAYAKDWDGFVASVEFFAGTNSLGFGQPIPSPLATNSSSPAPIPPIYPTNLFFLIWSNAPVGIYPVTAVATDNGGLATTSAPVNVTILPPLPPPTNNPPVVSIVATDPVAIEGTNSWFWPGETNATPTWAAWPTAVCRFFTNCGPKTATFAVRRFGDTNFDLTVPYAIGGTASNGVDYVALPGYITIPAGERRAFITVVPIDDGPPDVNKTVILTLLPDMQMNPLPGYVLGFPSRAAAIIIDPPGPCPAASLLPDKCFRLAMPGPDAAWFYVQCSTDLVNWTTLCTNQVIDGSIDFVDPDAAGNPSRFYRAVPLTNPPLE